VGGGGGGCVGRVKGLRISGRKTHLALKKRKVEQHGVNDPVLARLKENSGEGIKPQALVNAGRDRGQGVFSMAQDFLGITSALTMATVLRGGEKEGRCRRSLACDTSKKWPARKVPE